MKYRPEIDGLRALAVVPVILFHADVPGASGGFVGVDVFFVISGYLITSIILTEMDAGRFILADFYERRIRRILPALFTMCIVTMPVAFVVYSPSELRDYAQALMGVATFASNFVFWNESGYFDSAAELKPLLHTWSLAVEEQYYMVFPLLLLLARPWGRAGLIGAGLVLGVASFALAIVWIETAPMAGFFLLPARGWELLLGAGTACLLLWRPPAVSLRLGSVASLAGIAMIAGAALLLDKTTPTPGWATLVPTLGAALIVVFARPGTPARWLLSRRPLVGIGLVSYSLYLWHQPIFAFLRRLTYGTQEAPHILGALCLTAVLAYLSWRFVELPWRRAKGLSTNRALTVGIAAVAILAVGVTGHLSRGSFGRTLSDEMQVYAAALGDVAYPDGLYRIDSAGYYASDHAAPPEVLFFGDSHAEQYTPRLLALRDMGLLRPTHFLTGGGCPPVPGVVEARHPHCRGIASRVIEILEDTPSIDTVVIGACFTCYFIEGVFTRPMARADYEYFYTATGEPLSFLTEDGRQAALNGFIDFVTGLRSRARVLVILDNPASDNFDPGLMLASRFEAWNPFHARRYPELAFEMFDQNPDQRAFSNRLAAILVANEVEVFDPSPIVCPDGRCSAFNEAGLPLYKDAHHMRPFLVAESFSLLDAYFIHQP